jgi:LCP family protein required for cell wall assembly
MTADDASAVALQEVGDEIGQKLGIPIHGVIKADFTAFTSVVDAIGGVDVVVPKDIVDYTYPIAEGKVGTFKIDAGPQHLDGETALKYARSRHSTNDFDRSARQQQLLTAIADTIRGMGRIEQMKFLISLYDRLTGHVHTTMPTDQLLGLAQIASELSLDRIITMQINFNAGTDTMDARAGGFVYSAPPELYQGASVLLPTAGPDGKNDWSQIRTFAAFLLYDRALYLQHTQVLVENLSARAVDAHRFRNELLRYGWDTLPITYPAKKLPKPAPDSLVYYRDESHHDAATFLGQMLSLPVAKTSDDTQTGSGDVLIMLGSLFKYKAFQTLSGAVLR